MVSEKTHGVVTDLTIVREIEKVDEILLPSTIIDGSKTNIGTTGVPLGGSVSIKKGILVLCDSLGTAGTYIAFGNATSQSAKFLKTVGDALWIDWADNLSKIYVKGDNSGTNAAVSWTGG